MISFQHSPRGSPAARPVSSRIGPIGVEAVAPRVGQEDAERCRLADGPEAGLALPQRLLGPLSLEGTREDPGRGRQELLLLGPPRVGLIQEHADDAMTLAVQDRDAVEAVGRLAGVAGFGPLVGARR